VGSGAGQMAENQGLSKSTVGNIWRSHNLKPHRVKTFTLSRDPKFLEKLTDVVGLYLNPPEKAVVLCVDEKTQIQVLDCRQPGLPSKKGRCGSMTHDHKRNGPAPLFAALWKFYRVGLLPFVWTATVESIPSQTLLLPPDPGSRSARLYETANKEKREETV